jgi:hypothetical protein
MTKLGLNAQPHIAPLVALAQYPHRNNLWGVPEAVTRGSEGYSGKKGVLKGAELTVAKQWQSQ